MKKILLILCCALPSLVIAQSIKEFSEEPAKFIDEVNRFMDEGGKSETKDITNQFISLWNGKKFSSSQQSGIMRTANAMLKKRMKALPDFRNYLSALVSFAGSKQSEDSFEAWQLALDDLLEKRNKYFNSFIVTCNNLFQQQSLYISTSTQWKVTADSYSFSFDSLPKIVFGGPIRLMCISKGDSSIITDTKGYYYTSKNLWVGQGGKVTWTRAGVPEDSAYAFLRRYKIETTGSDYNADSVNFHYPAFFKNPLLGRLQEKILASSTPEKAIYPKFDSYENNNLIKNIDPGVDYRGGFSMHGGRFLGKGSEKGRATLTIHRNGKVFITASTRAGFVIKPDRMNSDNAELKIFLTPEDSMFHPSLEFKYSRKKQEVSIFRGTSGVTTSPIVDSYHMINIYFDALNWKMGDTTITVKMITGEGENAATFESTAFYRDVMYDRLMPLDNVSPLYKLRDFSQQVGGRTLYIDEYARFINRDITGVKGFLLQLNAIGLLAYNQDEQTFTLNERFFLFVDARVRKTDYDVIRFESKVYKKPNATLSLNTMRLNIDGVKSIALSDSQSVYIFPKEQTIVMKKNRDFDFGGKIFAGRMEFYGDKFTFRYDDFKIGMKEVDSVRFKVPHDSLEEGRTGTKKIMLVKSVIEKVNGELSIDEPKNKSARKNFPQYPLFESFDNSFVYYEKDEVLDAVYTKDRFFFKIDPFKIDSLDDIVRLSVMLKGDFTSSDIFPTFTDTLEVRPDYSLGLFRKTRVDEMPCYKAKGYYKNEIDLSHKGLRGKGSLDYLASNAKSLDFVFYPDSTLALAYEYTIKKDGPYPNVKGRDINVRWWPYKDIMYTTNTSTPFAMYDSTVMLNGGLSLTPKNLTGFGTADFGPSKLYASNFEFGPNKFGAPATDFDLKSETDSALAFSTKNVKSEVDLEKREATFKSNSPDSSYVSFPANQYIAYADKFKWMMDQKKIELGEGTAAGKPIKYVSTNAAQDSLQYTGTGGIFDIAKFILEAKGVKEIIVADALVMPDSGLVTVEKAAKMRTLKKAVVVANNDTKYHKVYDASIDILGRRDYKGTGSYDVVSGNTKQTVYMKEMYVKDSITIGIGQVEESQDFSISPQFAFKGNLTLRAPERDLLYTGFAKMRSRCVALEKSWIKFDGYVNPDTVLIPVDGFLDDQNNELAANLTYFGDSAGVNVTTTFMSPKKGRKGDEILGAKGFLTYNAKAGEYRISTKERLLATDSAAVFANYLALNEAKCTVFGEGYANISDDWGQVKPLMIGTSSSSLNTNETSLNLLISLDFFFSKEAISAMAEDMSTIDAIEPAPANDKTVLYKALSSMMGPEKIEELSADLEAYGSIKKLPKELETTLVLSEVKLVWDDFTKTFKGVGKFSFVAAGGKQVMKTVEGVVELQKRSRARGDLLNIYFEADEFGWYYFKYEKNQMEAISSNETFNDALAAVKPEKSQLKAEKGEDPYSYGMTTEKKMKEFVRRMNFKGRGRG